MSVDCPDTSKSDSDDTLLRLPSPNAHESKIGSRSVRFPGAASVLVGVAGEGVEDSAPCETLVVPSAVECWTVNGLPDEAAALTACVTAVSFWLAADDEPGAWRLSKIFDACCCATSGGTRFLSTARWTVASF